MAASMKENKLATAFKDKLEVLGCPFTEGVDESWIIQLIYQPGEPRIRLLQWLFSKFDSKLNELLDPQYASVDSKMDSRIQRLLFVASSLGLCSVDDADLVRGNCAPAKQSAFMDQLIDLVTIMDSSEDTRARTMLSPGTVGEHMQLDEQFGSDSWYMDTVSDTQKMDRLFCPDIKLLPPDIMKNIERCSEERRQTDKVQVPDLQKLVETADELSRNLDRQKEILQDLKKHYKLVEQDPLAMSNTNKTLQLGLCELSQLLVGFSYCFQNEMAQWCNKTPPRLTELGPAFKRVHTLLQHFILLVDSLGSVRSSHTHLLSDLKNTLQRLARNYGKTSIGSADQSALEAVQDCMDVLEESIVRAGNSSSANNTIISGISATSVRVDAD